MKQVISLFIFLCCCCTVSAQAPSMPVSQRLQMLQWLVGNWNQTNGKAGRRTIERWTKHSALELSGHGISLKGTDTVTVEKLKIISKENELFYVADVAGNKGLVYFKFTRLTADGFECENAQHDFPKKITYRKDGDKLEATVSGNGKSFVYVFEKVL